MEENSCNYSECHLPCMVPETQLQGFNVCGSCCLQQGWLAHMKRCWERKRLSSINQRNDGPEWPLPEASSFQLFIDRDYSSTQRCQGSQWLVQNSCHETSWYMQLVGTMLLSPVCTSSRDNRKAPQDLSHYLYVNMFINTHTYFLQGKQEES